MANYLINQDYSTYTQEDHDIWKMLCDRQSKLTTDKIAKQYLEGFYQLEIDKARVVKIEEVSKVLKAISGWTLVSVSGLLPAKDFFQMIINKCYPVTVSLRKPHEIDFSEQPDIFHDICGHLPLLTNEKFAQFLTAYSRIAIKYVNDDRAVDYLARLYWFTYEMGIISENGENKPYGAAIVTSAEEIANIQDPGIPKHPFDIDQIICTEFTPYSIQKEYFVINSFDDLFSSLENLESKLMGQLMEKTKELYEGKC